MTDSPPPSGRLRGVAQRVSVLVRSALAAAAVIGLVALGAVVNRPPAPPAPAPPEREAAGTPPAAATSRLEVPAPEQPPRPPTSADLRPPLSRDGPRDLQALQGFQMKPPAAPQAVTATTEPEPPGSDLYSLTLRLERGDTVDKLLADIDVPETDRRQIGDQLRGLLKKRRLAVGESIELMMQSLPEQPDVARLLSLSIRPQPEREFIITRRDDGTYEGEEKVYKVSPRLVRVEGEKRGPLEQSGIKAGAPAAAMVDFVRALAFDVDFQRELKEGQRFTLLLEQQVTSDGHVTHPGRFLAGELRLLKRTVTVLRFRPQGGAEGFYNPQGENLVRSFLRTPMDASRISSRFGMREHPILGFSALHAGVDFAAPSGTPILASGSGTVAQAGPNGGYGLYVKLQHTRDVATAYAHLSRLGPGIKPGVPVRQGQVIGFVGSTGMSTGPHLHYEFHRAGKAVNPLAQKFAMRATLAGKDSQHFAALSRQYLSQMKSAPAVAEATAEAPKDPPAKPPRARTAGQPM